MEESPFEVEHFVPNVMTSFTISLDKKFQVISYGKMLKSATKSHQNAANSDSSRATAGTIVPGSIHNENMSNKAVPFIPPPPDMHRSNRRFDDLISKLEKRYCSQGAYANESDEDDDNDGSNDARGQQDFSGSDMEVDDDNNTMTVPKKKKRAFQDAGEFDYEDPFIDDSEDPLITTLITKKTKTKHDGFFISSGVLEVTQRNKKGTGASHDGSGSGKSGSGNKAVSGGSKDKPKQQPKKKSSATVAAIIGTSVPRPIQLSAVPSLSPAKATSSSSTSTSKATISTAKPKPVATNNSFDSSIFSNTYDSVDTSVAAGEGKQRLAKQKVEWQPTHVVLSGIASLETLVMNFKRANNIKKFSPDGNDYTDRIDDYLIRMDDMVKAENGEVWSDSKAPSGYFERISEIMYNGESAPIRMKKIIRSIRSKNAAKVLYTTMTDAIKALKLDIVACTSSYTPPPPKADADAAPSPSRDSNQDTIALLDDADDIIEIDFGGGKGSADSSTKPAKAPVEYKFIVKWKSSMKKLAADTEEVLLSYIREENVYRAGLSASTRAGMETEDSDSLVEKSEFQKVLTNISLAFPAQCKDGDISALRRIISQEKARRRKEQKKEVEKKLGALTGSPSPSLVSSPLKSSVQAAVMPKEPKKEKKKKEKAEPPKEKKEKAEHPKEKKVPVLRPPLVRLPELATEAATEQPPASSNKDSSMQRYSAGLDMLPGDPVWGVKFETPSTIRNEDFVAINT